MYKSIGQFTVLKCTTVKDLSEEYIGIYGHNKWGVSTYDGNVGLFNNYIIPTIGNTKLSEINTHFMEKYYTELLEMPAVVSACNMNGEKKITAATVNQIHKVLRSCFRQAVKWGLMDKNPATDATVPKHKKQEREIWTAEMLMQAIEACDNKWLKVAFHASACTDNSHGNDHEFLYCRMGKSCNIFYGFLIVGLMVKIHQICHVLDRMTVLCESGSKDHILFCFPDSIAV